MTDKELGTVFKTRRDNKMDRLFVMNISCDSEMCVPAWMHTYKGSISHLKKNEIETFDDVPIVIAAKRGFDTESANELKEHFKYPIAVLELASQGVNIEKVVDYLKGNKNSDSDDSERGFNPYTNIEEPILFNSGGIEAMMEIINYMGEKKSI